MPELPEVEALARFLNDRIRGREVVAADVASIAALKTFDPPVDALIGRTSAGATRRGKWLDLPFSDDTDAAVHLVFHLARGGWVRWSDKAPTTPVRPRLGGSSKGAALAFRMRFDDASGFSLTEAGSRKRLAVYIVRDPAQVEQIASLGPEPLAAEFTVETLAGLLAERNQQVKGLLRDQSAIAGIGNAYSDEILHVARMSPFKLTRSFTDAETRLLHAAVTETLTGAVAASAGRPAAELKDAKRRGMRVHGRAGQPCPVCGDTVREVSFADRALQYCPTCQTGGQPLADRRMSRLLK